MPTGYEIANAVRTVYYDYVSPPKKVGNLTLSPPLSNGQKIPLGLAYSKVMFGQHEYYETSPAVLGYAGRNSGVPVSGADNLKHNVERFRHHHQTYGVVIGIEARTLNAVITDKNGTALHQYPVLG